MTAPGGSGSETLFLPLPYPLLARIVDDGIIYALNLSTPTSSIQARGANTTGTGIFVDPYSE